MNIFAKKQFVTGVPTREVAPRITHEILPWAAAAGIFDNGARWMVRIYVDTYLFEQAFTPTYTVALKWLEMKRVELRTVMSQNGGNK